MLEWWLFTIAPWEEKLPTKEFIEAHEVAIRHGFICGIFVVMALWKIIAPCRVLTVPKAVRWVNKLGLVALNSMLLHLLFPIAAVELANIASDQGWGILSHWQVPYWLAVLLAVVLLDFVIWLQHVMMHAIPALWRLHRLHHSVEDDEANSNFGFNLSIWDRLFGTYLEQPRGGHTGMTIGIHGYRDLTQVARLPGMLALPFIGKISGYTNNRRNWGDKDS